MSLVRAADSFRGAKVIAGRNKEYWDNRQGWHMPEFYLAEDCKQIITEGKGTIPAGLPIVIHIMYVPVVTGEQ